MKFIAAYIQPFAEDKVTDALREKNIHGVTVVNCKGFGRRADDASADYLDREVEMGFAPKIKIEIVCGDDQAETIVRTIAEKGHTGRYGDGKIFMWDVCQAMDIRTGQQGEAVL